MIERFFVNLWNFTDLKLKIDARFLCTNLGKSVEHVNIKKWDASCDKPFKIDKPSYFFGCAHKDTNLHKNSHSGDNRHYFSKFYCILFQYKNSTWKTTITARIFFHVVSPPITIRRLSDTLIILVETLRSTVRHASVESWTNRRLESRDR